MERCIGSDSFGYFLEVYDEATDRFGRWYGTRQECEACPTEAVELHPYKPGFGVDPFDLACERRYD